MATVATIEVGEAGLAGLRMKADKLNKRAKRKGMNELVVRVVRAWTTEPDCNGYTRRMYCVDIEGSAPRIDGWTIAARIELNSCVGTIVHVVPGEFADCDYSVYREHNGHCDHCDSRRRRNDVFVLADSNDHRMVVGRNCLADFVRNEDASDFAAYAEFCEIAAGWTDSGCSEDAYSDGWGQGRSVPTIPLDRYLRATSLIIRNDGWMSRGNARDRYNCTATADSVSYYFYGHGKNHTNWINCMGAPSDGDVALAEKSIEWAKSLSDKQLSKSEYLYTIHAIATTGIVGPGLDGYAASIIAAYQRDCERNAEYAKKAADSPEKDYIGCIKERIKGLDVRVLRIRYFEGNYGVTTIVAMEADLPGGKVAPITWFASGSKDFAEGDYYTLTATVKGHEDKAPYGKQTIVTRAILKSR